MLSSIERCCWGFAILLLYGTLIGSVLLSVWYVRGAVFPLDHALPDEGAGYALGSYLLLIPVAFVVGSLAWGKNKCCWAALAAIAVFAVQLIALFSTQSGMLAHEFQHGCARLGYDTRLTVNRAGSAQLYLLSQGVSVRGQRHFSDHDTGLNLEFALDADAVRSLQLNLSSVGIKVDLNVDGLNTSVTSMSASSASSRIGNVTFRLQPPRAEFQLMLGNDTRLLRSWPKVDWWSNPSKILNSDGVEMARTIRRHVTGSRLLTICGRRENLDLTFLLAAMTHPFQVYGSKCSDEFHGSSLDKCRDCVEWGDYDECVRSRIIDSCQTYFRQFCKGITY